MYNYIYYKLIYVLYSLQSSSGANFLITYFVLLLIPIVGINDLESRRLHRLGINYIGLISDSLSLKTACTS